jgi:hypothetical protein
MVRLEFLFLECELCGWRQISGSKSPDSCPLCGGDLFLSQELFLKNNKED